MKSVKMFLFVMALALLLVPAAVLAADDTGCIGGAPDGQCADTETSLVCKSDCEAPCAINSVITKITNLVLVAAGVIAILSLVIVGIMFMQAGDPQQKEKLGGRLKGIIIGLVIIVVAKPVTMFIFSTIFVGSSHCVGG